MSIYICGDIHGQYGLYKKMLKDIHFGRGDQLFIIGDVIDRGPDGIRILQDVIKRGNAVCLLGNHELMMYDNLTGSGETGESWTMWNNGGEVTREGFRRLKSWDRRKITVYLENLYLQIELKLGGRTWLLSHSSFLEQQGSVRWKDVPYQDALNTVWDSPWRTWEHVPAEKYGSDGRYHIIGHVPVQRIYTSYRPGNKPPSLLTAYEDETNHLINIDCGCAIYDENNPIPGFGLCCLNLTEYAEGDASRAFKYYS